MRNLHQQPRYVVRYFDPELGRWMDGSTPLPMGAARVCEAFYAEAFDAKIVFAGVDVIEAT